MNSDDLTLAALVAGIITRWRAALGVTIGVVALALLLSFVLPPRYQSQSTFVVATEAGVQLPKGLADLATQSGLSGLASQFGLAGSDPSTSPAFYGQLLGSRELLTRLVSSRFPDPWAQAPGDSADLLVIYRIREKDHERAIEIAIKRVKRDMKVTFDARTSLVAISVNARGPEVSAAVANRAVELVSAFNSEQRLSRARARRVFLESRVSEAQAELRAAEAGLRNFYEQNRQWQNSPGLTLEERRVRRQVETASDLYLSIRRAFESARIDEVNDTPVITVVDRAVPPRKPLWPRHLLILLTAGVLGAGLGMLWAAARTVASHWAGQHPTDAAGLHDAAVQFRSEVGRALGRRRAGASRPSRPT
jgi:uncharacterized protein involved in exopolysaccharide biosynthesis